LLLQTAARGWRRGPAAASRIIRHDNLWRISAALFANRVVWRRCWGPPYNSTVEVLTHDKHRDRGDDGSLRQILGGPPVQARHRLISTSRQASGTDAEFRLYRDAGANGQLIDRNAGSGTLTLSCNTAAHTLVMNNVGVATSPTRCRRFI
jgi:hypothetical protein